MVRIFRDFGQRELNLMVAFGFIFGFLLGIPVAFVDHCVPPVVAAAGARRHRRLDHQRARHVADLRAAGAERILGIKVHGLFLRRQDEAAEVYARIIADDVITLEQIGDFLLDGPRGDRTRQMLATAMRPGDRQGGRPGAGGGAGGASGAGAFDTIRDSFAQEAVGPHDHAVPGPGVQPAAGGEDPGAGRHAAPRSCRRGTSWR